MKKGSDRIEFIKLNGRKYKCTVGTLNMDKHRQQEVIEFMIDKIEDGVHEGKVLNLFQFDHLLVCL